MLYGKMTQSIHYLLQYKKIIRTKSGQGRKTILRNFWDKDLGLVVIIVNLYEGIAGIVYNIESGKAYLIKSVLV